MGIRPDEVIVSTWPAPLLHCESQFAYQWKTSRRWPTDASRAAMTGLGSLLPSASLIHMPHRIGAGGANGRVSCELCGAGGYEVDCCAFRRTKTVVGTTARRATTPTSASTIIRRLPPDSVSY